MKSISRWTLLGGVVVVAACQTTLQPHELVLTNTLDIAREEVISIPITKLKDAGNSADTSWQVSANGDQLISQILDKDGDGEPDQLLFLIALAPHAEQTIQIVRTNPESPDAKRYTYSRFVPERIDDYAWENDRVAFRTYGPEAQRLVDDGEPGGTLSSGIDCWLKRVDYLIINKWYDKPANGRTYHVDDGEGYDPYHVGDSRGCGGTGVWKDDSLYVSKNFVSYKTLATGPMRTVFELSYAAWPVDSISVQEIKRITLDKGDQLCKIELLLKPTAPLPNTTIGISLHNKDGVVTRETSKGVFSYWEPLDDSELGTGVVVDPKQIIRDEDFRTQKKDLSHLLIITKPTDTLTYYTGFGWKKAGRITTAASWNEYLEEFAQRKAHPVEVVWK